MKLIEIMFVFVSYYFHYFIFFKVDNLLDNSRKKDILQNFEDKFKGILITLTTQKFDENKLIWNAKVIKRLTDVGYTKESNNIKKKTI